MQVKINLKPKDDDPVNIQFKDGTLSKKIKKFHEKKYDHMTIPKFFLHAVFELMKREK
jgi:NADH:ubiquinone oxidoreductase subunit B-like Fe-S oxidoreductase